MLYIILLILKIIGITLLAIIGLLLLILLVVLLVPIRYRVAVTHGDDDFYLESRMSWLLHLIGARITHLEGKLHIRVRVLWFTLYDNLRPRKPKVEKKKHAATAKRRKKKSIKKKSVKKTKVVSEKSDKSTIHSDRKSKIDEVSLEQKESNIISDSASKSEIRQEITEKIIDNENNKIRDVETSRQDDFYEDIDYSVDEDKKISLFEKISNKIKAVKDKVLAFFGSIKLKIIQWFDTITNLKHKLDLILEFIRDEINREGFRITYDSLKKLLKHILPTKLKSKVIFGTGDPCSTGQAMGVLGFLYSIYGDKVVIIPDFEKKRLEGEHYASGRIRLVTILIIVIKLILDKRFKQLKNNFQILKEAL